MSERKVLNKYYPPDFDPSKIPKGKRNKNAVFNIRIMAPFNMRCNMCKEYIYKGKKFNSRKEDVMDETYLGLRIFRFYIKCPRCVSEIAFKTDLENTDYTLEAGATRLFEAEKLAMKMAEQEMKEKEEDEMNPMKLLENRTKTSRQEMDQIDSLEELREINSRKNIVNTDEMIEKYRKYEELLHQLQIEQEEKEIREIFGEKGGQLVKRLNDSDDEGEPAAKKPALTTTTTKPTEILVPESSEVKTKPLKSWEKSVGSLSSKSKLKGLVVRKKHAIPAVSLGNQTIKTEASSNQGQSCGANDLTSEKPAITLTENENSESIDKKTINTIVTAEATKQSDHTSENISKQPRKVTNDMAEQSAQQIVKESIPVKETPKMSSGGKGAISLICAYSDSDSDTSN